MYSASPRPVFRLAGPAPSHDTIQALEDLLQDARSGKLVGLLYCAMFDRRAYRVGAAGEAHRSPTFARGMVCALDDELRRNLDEIA